MNIKRSCVRLSSKQGIFESYHRVKIAAPYFKFYAEEGFHSYGQYNYSSFVRLGDLLFMLCIRAMLIHTDKLSFIKKRHSASTEVI